VGGVAEADLRARGLGRQGGIPEEGARVEGVRRDRLAHGRGARVDGDLQELEAGCAGAVRAEVGNELGGGGRRKCERTANEERKRRYQPEIRGRRSEVRTSTSNIGTPTSDIRHPTSACSSDAALSKTHTPPPTWHAAAAGSAPDAAGAGRERSEPRSADRAARRGRRNQDHPGGPRSRWSPDPHPGKPCR